MRTLFKHIRDLCRGEPETFLRGFEHPTRTLAAYTFLIVVGAGVYGATIGLWRAPLQALYTAAKFPMVILFTTAGNALLNGMLAQLMGLRIGFRQSVLAVTASFAIASVTLGSLSPVTLFMTFNTPPLTAGNATLSHSTNLLFHVAIIAFAGVVGNVSLYRLLSRICQDGATARKVLLSWLAGNAFLGCQASWIMRPFIGSPGLPVEFFRSDAFDGNFYESVWRSFSHVLNTA